MAGTVFQQGLGTLQHHRHFGSSAFYQEYGNESLKLISKGFKVNLSLMSQGSFSSNRRNFSVIQASTSHTTIIDPVSTTSNDTSDSKTKTSTRNLRIETI